MLLMLGQQGLGEPHSQVHLLLALAHAKHRLGQGWGGPVLQPPAALPLLCTGLLGQEHLKTRSREAHLLMSKGFWVGGGGKERINK